IYIYIYDDDDDDDNDDGEIDFYNDRVSHCIIPNVKRFVGEIKKLINLFIHSFNMKTVRRIIYTSLVDLFIMIFRYLSFRITTAKEKRVMQHEFWKTLWKTNMYDLCWSLN
ncbi:hypothetical protein LSH36_218g02013, partial [Paralvinella palmiformis]